MVRRTTARDSSSRNRRFRVAATTATLAGLAATVHTARTARAALLFDNVTAAGGFTSTGSTPNTFMGDGYNLGSGVSNITGFDLFPVNLSGTNYSGGIQANVYFWGSVNTGTVNASNPAFSNLVATTTVTITGEIDTGFRYSIVSSMPGVTPGVTFTTPLNISSSVIGFSVNYTGSNDFGTTYNSANSLTSAIAYNGSNTAGAAVFNGYYRNANSETNGNFTAGLRTLSFNNQSLALRVYGTASGVIVGGTPHTWAGPFSGNWTDASGWTPATVPAAADPTTFNTATDGRTAAGYTVTLPSAITAASAAVLADRVTFDLPNVASSLTLTGALAAGQPTSSATAAAPTYGFLSLTNSTAGAIRNVSAGSVSVGSGNTGIGSLSVGSRINLMTAGNTNVSGGSVLTLASNAALVTGTLSLGPANASTGKVDVATGVIDVTGSTLAAVTALVRQGYANGTFAGNGITSSDAASNAAHLTGVGVIANNQSGAAIYSSARVFDNGLVPGAGDVLVKYTYFGDTNLDGVVNAADYTRIDAGFVGGLSGWGNGDFNLDGIVDGTDYTLMDTAFNLQTSTLVGPSGVFVNPATAAGGAAGNESLVGNVPYGGSFTATATPVSGTANFAAASATAVPEPTSAVVLAAAAGLLAGRRRSRR